jgi:hypothetical protein
MRIAAFKQPILAINGEGNVWSCDFVNKKFF